MISSTFRMLWCIALIVRFRRGKPLAECKSEHAEAVAYLTRVGAGGQLVGAVISERAIARLLGSDGDETTAKKADADAVARVEASTNAQWAYSHGQCQTMVSFLLGHLLFGAGVVGLYRSVQLGRGEPVLGGGLSPIRGADRGPDLRQRGRERAPRVAKAT